MKQNSLLKILRPRSHAHWRTLPIFGALTEDFVLWLQRQGYTLASIANHLAALRQLVCWLQRRRIHSLTGVDEPALAKAHADFLQRMPTVGGTVRALRLFLRERGTISEGSPARPSPSEAELLRFTVQLREVRGLAERTILAHQRRLRPFLKFLRFDRHPAALRTLRVEQVEAFLQVAARTNNRFSLQHVVATLRAFLKHQHAHGVIRQPLHERIDTPRVYRLERLPRAWAWPQVQALLRSIDRSGPEGRRDFTLLYLAAAYGLRSGELVRLTLDDLDWRAGTLRVPQTKTSQALALPLTDEAAKVLIDYLRQDRARGRHRQLFLRLRAPSGPLASTAVHDVLEKRIRRSGLKLPHFGSHGLRHSFAVHLLRQQVSMKSIGDALGHRDPESTAVYLRLSLEDLREVGLPVPPVTQAPLLSPSGWQQRIPRVRVQAGRRGKPAGGFVSGLAGALQRFLKLKRALGRRYAIEAATLRDWDRFLQRRHPGVRRIGPAMFHAWAAGLGRLAPTVHRNHMRIVRNFLLFHARQHPRTFIPDRFTFPQPSAPRPPRLVSVAEAARLLAAARTLAPSHYNPLRAETVRLAVLLLFCCGLRRGELLRLKLSDFDPVERLLRINGTKFHKSRLVPLSDSVAAELRGYLQQRRRAHLSLGTESPLIWSGRRPDPRAGYTPAGLADSWHHLCVSTSVLDERERPPRLHDLRHSFAVAALQRWYAQRLDAQAKLPHLATYLGHVNPVSTHYYLRLTPELRAAASERFQQRFGNLLHSGGVA